MDQLHPAVLVDVRNDRLEPFLVRGVPQARRKHAPVGVVDDRPVDHFAHPVAVEVVQRDTSILLAATGAVGDPGAPHAGSRAPQCFEYAGHTVVSIGDHAAGQGGCQHLRSTVPVDVSERGSSPVRVHLRGERGLLGAVVPIDDAQHRARRPRMRWKDDRGMQRPRVPIEVEVDHHRSGDDLHVARKRIARRRAVPAALDVGDDRVEIEIDMTRVVTIDVRWHAKRNALRAGVAVGVLPAVVVGAARRRIRDTHVVATRFVGVAPRIVGAGGRAYASRPSRSPAPGPGSRPRPANAPNTANTTKP